MPADSALRYRSASDHLGSAWAMLLALTGGFALSQAYRTVAAIMAPQLQAEFGPTRRRSACSPAPSISPSARCSC